MERLLTNIQGLAQTSLPSALRNQLRFLAAGEQAREVAQIAASVALVITMWGLSWEECGENPAVFCYRIYSTLGSALGASRRESRA